MTSKFTDAERAYMAAHVPAGQPGKNPKAVRFSSLRVIVRDGDVLRDGWSGPARLGPLAGSHAEITDGTRPHRIALAALTLTPVIALTRKNKASAFVVFADGTVHECKLDGKKAIGRAQRDVVKFNALAAAAR